jgi:hypothetical protein
MILIFLGLLYPKDKFIKSNNLSILIRTISKLSVSRVSSLTIGKICLLPYLYIFDPKLCPIIESSEISPFPPDFIVFNQMFFNLQISNAK